MGKAKIENKPETKRRGNPNWVKGGPSPNPAGRPQNEVSLTAIAKRFLAMKPSEIAAEINHLAGNYRLLGKGSATMGELVIGSMLYQLVNDPQPGNLRELWRRIDGEVDQTFNINDWRKEAQEAGYNPDELVQQFARAMVAGAMAGSESSSTGEAE